MIQRAADEGVESLSRIEELIGLASESPITVAAAIEEQSAVTAQIGASMTAMATQADELHRILVES